MSRSCGRAETLVHTALAKPVGTPGTDPDLLITLQGIFNEAEWLERLAKSFLEQLQRN